MSEKLKLGALLSFVNNTDSYAQSLDETATLGNAALLAGVH